MEETIQRELTTADYLAMLRRHWVLILVLTLIGPPVGYGVSRVIPPRYVSQTMVLVQPQVVPDQIVPQMDTTTMNQKLASLKQQILSRSSLEPVIRQYGLFSSDIRKKSMDELVLRLQKDIDVTPVAPLAETGARDLPGFSVTVTLDDAHKAQDICTQLTAMFIQASNGTTIDQNDQIENFLKQQLTDAKASLDQQDAKLAAFKSRYMGALPDDQQTNLQLLAGWNSQLEADSQALARAQQDKTFEESMLQQQLATLQTTADGQNPTTLEQQLATLKTQLATELGMYKDTYPDVVKTKADIAAMEKQIAAAHTEAAQTPTRNVPTAEPVEITNIRTQIHSYEQMIAEKTHEQEDLRQKIKLYEGRVQQSPEVEAQYTELTRGYNTAQDAYNALLKQQHQAEMSSDLNREQQGEYFHVLDAANLPSKPTSPNRLMFTAAGLFGGLGLGLGMTLFFELKDTSLKSERDVEFILRLPVLALIPEVEPVASSKSANRTAIATAKPDASLSLRA